MTSDASRPILKSQYHAALAMLKDAIEKCPDDLWLDDRVTNRFWQIAYHVLHYTRLYLHVDLKSAQPWSGHQAEVQYPGGLPNPHVVVDKNLPVFAEPYTKAQVLDLWQSCDRLVDAAIDSFDLDSPDCGFWWYQMGKLEHQFLNIRHLQHHTGQLADRLRTGKDVGVAWVGAQPS
jgi:DinB superfamily